MRFLFLRTRLATASKGALLFGVGLALSSSCSDEMDEGDNSKNSVSPVRPGHTGGESEDDEGAAGTAGKDGSADDGAPKGAMPDGGGAPEGGKPGPGGGSGGGNQDPLPQPGQLTAGEWRDNANWPWLVSLMGQHQTWRSHSQSWRLDPLKTCAVSLQHNSVPLRGAKVILRGAQQQELWTAHTDGAGKAMLVNGLFSGQSSIENLEVEVQYGGQKAMISNFVCTSPDKVAPFQVGLAPIVQARKSLDLMFTVDTTGSMGDELRYLQSELQDVITRVQNEHANAVDIRLSLNFYRDVGDQYVVKPHPFTSDIQSAITLMQSEVADGGGDFPEAVDQALENAVSQHQWRSDAISKLVFLVLDAPPHNDPASRQRVVNAVKAAAAQGIQIIPVVSSGIDKSTEVLLRSSLSVATNSTYVFLTNHSGIGGDHLDPTVGQYEVEKLNALLTRLIAGSL